MRTALKTDVFVRSRTSKYLCSGTVRRPDVSTGTLPEDGEPMEFSKLYEPHLKPRSGGFDHQALWRGATPLE